MYRPEITVVDCTIRDGGLMNNSHFPDEVVKAVYRAACASGVHYVELGYKNSKKHFDDKEFGAWRFCEEADLRRITAGVETETKLAVMMDSHKSYKEDLLPCSESVIDMVRVATYVKDIDKAIAIENHAHELGYETAINIMAISHTIERDLEEALKQINNETNVKGCYIVDSFGNLYSEDVDFYYSKYREQLKDSIEVGVHCHNNQQLAFANTIQGIIRGANWMDATMLGIGRGAGNCPLELLLGFLKNPRFDVRPVFDCIGKHIRPMQETIDWGYHIPYMIAGVLNMRPDDSMKMMKLPKDDPKRFDYAEFYDTCNSNDSI